MQQYLLTAIILIPVIGALALVAYNFLPSRQDSNFKWIALVFSVMDFAASLPLISGIGAGTKDFRIVEDVLWISTIGARYHIGVDDISLWLVVLTSTIMSIVILSRLMLIRNRHLSYDIFLLLLAGVIVCVFVFLYLLLFYLCLLACFVQMFFLLVTWGGE